ncbi:hypothetical protein FQN57_002796 [Myotisia sp. PD_48]|nr:hypothetical protein FQN57_002796 [Myotisia sp. PD_48]
MDSVNTGEHPKKLPSPPVSRQPLPHPRSSYEIPWSNNRSLFPYDSANIDQQRTAPSYSAPPPPPRDMSQFPGELYPGTGPAQVQPRAPNGQYRMVNGSHESNGGPSLPPTSTEPRPRLTYEPQPNEVPQSLHISPPVDGMPPVSLSHRQYAHSPSNPVNATPVPFDTGYYPGQSVSQFQQQQQQQQQRRRTTRAQQACDQCRARKARCDEGRPSCGHCKDNNVTCVYKDVPPHKHERSTQLLLDRLQQLDDQFKDFLKGQEARNTKLEAKIDTLVRNRGSKTPQSPSLEPESIVEDIETFTQLKEEAPINQSFSQARSPSDVATEDIEKPGPILDIDIDVDDEGLSIPIEHTTAAHKLLLWPSIQKLLPGRINEDYVMELEEARGPIRPYGRGEGDDEHDLLHAIHANDIGVAKSLGSPEGNDCQIPSIVKDFGTAADVYHPNHSIKSPKQVTRGGLSNQGGLNFDFDVMRGHCQSYKDNMHILHPFLSPHLIDDIPRRFSSMFPSNIIAINHVGQVDHPLHISRVPKRKRSLISSNYPTELESPVGDYNIGSGSAIVRSVENAICLLVLAVGAICAWKSEIPGPVKDPYQNLISPYTIPGASPMLSDPSIISPHSSPENMSFPNYTRRFSTQSGPIGPEPPELKNIDVIPGMAYYALASDILGNTQGGCGLQFAQASLLAALYTGQLAHPFVSHGWISQAARATQVLVRNKRYQRMPNGPRKDLTCLSFWTCLQLESDILAELDLPASGISRLEGSMEFPKGVFAHFIPNDTTAPSTIMMIYYSAQVHLRKVLNRVHTDLYKAETKESGEKVTRWSTKVQEALSVNLEQWRALLPPEMQWNDTDPPSPNINIARMRGKYYGAKYIIHRPLLHHALHPMAPKVDTQATAPTPSTATSSSQSQQVSPNVYQTERVIQYDTAGTVASKPPVQQLAPQVTTPIPPPPPPSLDDLEPGVHRACVTCIEAAMNSTVAFDGVEGRPIVTNIFGTAHAQFGNMLVLSATYTSQLSQLVDGNKLYTLLNRTIDFLLKSRHISPTLRKDAEILTLIRQKLFPVVEPNYHPLPQ